MDCSFTFCPTTTKLAKPHFLIQSSLYRSVPSCLKEPLRLGMPLRMYHMPTTAKTFGLAMTTSRASRLRYFTRMSPKVHKMVSWSLRPYLVCEFMVLHPEYTLIFVFFQNSIDWLAEEKQLWRCYGVDSGPGWLQWHLLQPGQISSDQHHQEWPGNWPKWVEQLKNI